MPLFLRHILDLTGLIVAIDFSLEMCDNKDIKEGGITNEFFQ